MDTRRSSVIETAIGTQILVLKSKSGEHFDYTTDKYIGIERDTSNTNNPTIR